MRVTIFCYDDGIETIENVRSTAQIAADEGMTQEETNAMERAINNGGYWLTAWRCLRRAH